MRQPAIRQCADELQPLGFRQIPHFGRKLPLDFGITQLGSVIFDT